MALPRSWIRALRLERSPNPYDCPTLAASSSHNPKADPRLTTKFSLSREEALRARVSYAADHPLRKETRNA